MILKHLRIALPFLLVICLTITGCVARKVEPLTPTEAQQRFAEICNEEFGLKAVMKPMPHTLWIYIPFEESFFAMQVKGRSEKMGVEEVTEKPSIKHIETEFKDRKFFIEYDIGLTKTYNKDYGFSSSYSQEFQIAQQKVLNALNRAFSHAEDLEQSGETSEVDSLFVNEQTHLQEFYAIVMSDISQGIYMTTYINREDIKRASYDYGFQEEYMRRIVYDYPIGEPMLKGDETGQNLEIKDLTWGDFIAKQIISRLQFKYGRSSFTPSENPEEEVLDAFVQALEAYEFEDFDSVVIENKADGTIKTISKELLPEPKDPYEDGRTINIKFGT